ncbi:hypothetical protein lerEdw1_010168 [Lerista edwardsae]|nr:hypothetical protein lerEdw1_010168 [Lerista edwardsae]
MVTTDSSEPGGVRQPGPPFSHLLGPLSLQTLKNPKVEKAEILELAVEYLREMNSAQPQGTIGWHGGVRGKGVNERPVRSSASGPAQFRCPKCLSDQPSPRLSNSPLAGADLSTDRTLQTCYLMGFRECFLGLAAFIQQAHPAVQSHLLDTLHLYLASKPEPRGQDWSCGAFSPGSSLGESPPRTPEGFCSPLKKLDEPLRSPEPPCSSTGQHGSQQRLSHESPASAKGLPPPPAFWRPWP